MAELQARLAEAEKALAASQAENAALRSENERLRDALATWDRNYSLRLDLPDADQALVLWKKITSKYPRMVSPTDRAEDQAAGMVAAMGYIFTVKKTEKPTTRYDGAWWLSRATEFQNKARLTGRIRSVLLAVIATNDVSFTLSNSDLFLDVFGRGAPVDRSAWRKLLTGAPVREPTVINKPPLDESIGHVKVGGVW
jgi:hypothetical protein